MTPDRYWCEYAWLGGPAVTPGVVVQTGGERIASVTTGVPAPPAGSTRLDGLTLPALANAHSHAFHRALRGRTHDGGGDFWTWRELMYAVAGRLDPGSYRRLARAVYAEMAQAGVGVVGEFHYVHHRQDGTRYDEPNAMGDALVAAAADVGIRLTLLDTVYLHGGFDDGSGHRPLDAVQARFGDGSVEAWAARADDLQRNATGPTVAVGAAVHSVRAVDPAAIEAVAAWCARHDAPLHAHVSEQPAEHHGCVDRFATTPIGLLARSGALGPRTTLVHATHADDDDLDRMAAAGSSVCVCPTTERDLGDGIGPTALLADAGVPMCLGSDSHAVVDLLEEARALELDERLGALARGGHPPHELARLATSNGYTALGWPDGGALAAGALADFTTVRLDSVRLAGTTLDHALASVVYAGSAADVDHVVVAGREIVVAGRHASIDAAAELAREIRAVVAA